MYRNWRELIRPKSIEIEHSTLSESYGRFIAEPLERGFGITIGNTLRRVLLSSIRGSAIVGVKIEGALHEFTSIDGVVEDVADIVLNLKEVQLRCAVEGPVTLRLEANESGKVTAAALSTSNDVEILNPEHHIATIIEGGKLEMEMVVASGKGYVPAEQNKSEDWSVGMIAVDAIFSPIHKVNYRVTNARVGQRTDYDRLSLEVWTNGAVLPEDAVGLQIEIRPVSTSFYRYPLHTTYVFL